MELVECKKDKKIVLKVTEDEIYLLINALNEVCYGIEVWEFDSRLGTTIEEAGRTLSTMGSIYREAKILWNSPD
ncbi:MAG: hypothetical protein LLG04_00520 [Parachlamydia sp.]|nr:hypothetical protein [Parachlamydia sp.]